MANVPRFSRPDLNIALVRFSALGDVTLAVPAVRRIKHCLPEARITWITSPLAHSLLEGLEGVNFEVHKKPSSFADYRAFYRAYRERAFDVVLAMQANLRINLLYPALHAPVKIGFDFTRAREGQWLFCNSAITPAGQAPEAHLLDSFLAFAARLGALNSPIAWDLPIGAADREFVREKLKNLPRPLIAIHPCASKPERTWLLERYKEVIRAAVQAWGAGIVLTGGHTAAELEFCVWLQDAAPNVLNLCGRTTPKQLAALLEEADVLVAPDTGPVHMARAVNTPVVGLYAVASPALTGPYKAQEFIVNRYPDAVKKYLRKDSDALPWNTRVHNPGAMALIETRDVLENLARALKR
jgi:heptosyltransferase I